MSITKNKKALLASLIVMVVMAAYVNHTEKLTPLEIYTDMLLSYDDSQDIAVEKYLVQYTEHLHKFLIAPSTPDALQLKLSPRSDAHISLHIEPLYLPSDCTLGQLGLSTLQLQSGPGDADKQSITLNRIYNIDLKLTANQGLGILLNDHRDGRCGRATLTFSKKNSSYLYIAIFLTVWSLLAIILAYINGNPLIAIMGAALNLVLIIANATIQPASIISFSATILASASITGLLLLFASLPIWRFLKATLMTVIVCVSVCLPLIFILYPHLFNGPVNEDTIHAVLQSNPRQAGEFWLAFIGLQRSVVLALSILVLFALIYLVSKPFSGTKTTAVTGFLLLLASIILWRNAIDNIPTIALTEQSITGYFNELEAFKELREERIANLIEVGATTDRDNQTLVVVLGESASKHHMSSYGYGRETTPNADRLIQNGAMIRFDAAFSNHVHSNPTISKALTSASSYTNDAWINSPSILNLANAAGVKTTWVSNKPMYGVWDNHMNVIGNEASEVLFINKRVGTEKSSSEHDAAMLSLVHQTISADEINQLVFMHLQGSHVHYCARVPSDFNYFNEDPERYVFGNLLKTEENNSLITRFLNCYDNSIRYSDYVINELIKHLDVVEKPSAVLYISDHGENVLDNKAHNASDFDYYMAEIPAFFWANTAWRQQHPNIWQNLLNNHDKVFTNDHLFEFVNGLTGVSSPAIDTHNDPSASEYIEPVTPKTMHGEVHLNAADNWTFWQRQNLRELNTNSQLSKIVAHRVNTTSKAGTMLKQGLGALEIDLTLQKLNLIVGHDATSSAEINLEDFIAKLDWAQVTRLWLDMRNLGVDDIESALNRLNALNRNTQLQQKAILIVNEENQLFKRFSESGFQLAYAPSEAELVALVNVDDLERQKRLESINIFTQDIGASIISLPADYYSQINQDLEILLNNDRSLHLRLPSDLDLATPNLSASISKQDYFDDKRVTAISFKVRSRHDL